MRHRLLVNWTDSMGVAPADLRQIEDFFIELTSNGLAIGTENHKFGLLPPISGEKESVDMEIKESVTGNLELVIRKFYALTQGGYLIRFEAAAGEELVSQFLQVDKAGNSDGWNIIMTFNPYQRIPVGIPDEEEYPPRHPNTDATVHIHFLPISEVNSYNLNPQQLIIGRVMKNEGSYLIGEYIPPCVYMASHPVLVTFYNHLSSMMESMERNSREIINKVRDKKTLSPLAVNIEMISRQVMDYISSVYFNFNNAGLYWSPFQMTGCFSTLAHKLYMNFCFIPSAEKEEMFTYFSEWGEISPGMFETCISEVLEMQYDHYDIRSSMVLVDKFMYILSQLWDILSRLEYIGQHKESIIVSDKKLGEEKRSPKRWGFLGG